MSLTTLAGQWQLSDETGTHRLDIALPGDLITALHAARQIADPYWGMNEYDVRWVADRDWTATRTITLAADQTDADLVVSRLDTIASISVNDAPVAVTENAFRRYRFPLTGKLTAGSNTIKITFHSPVRAANERQASQPFFVPFTEHYPGISGNMLRKPQCDFGWDWNAALMPMGLYGDMYLDADTGLVLGDTIIQQDHSAHSVSLTINQKIDAGSPQQANATLCGQTVAGTLRDGQLVFTMQIDNPDLWWPVNQGPQTLHDLLIEVDGRQINRRVGLRKLELVSEPDEVGRSFMFVVNGRPVFAMGANWIPEDALAGNTSASALRGLLQSAIDANMNMVRVWGGGWYESDLFYDLCDEMGILVWQDAMFSCSLYPADDAFLAEVAAEVRDNAGRLQHHACLALWCGDNELIGALTWYEESVRDRDRYLVAYDRLNRVIEAAVREVDAQANWWPSSPSPGPLSFGDAWHDDSSGDMHFWSVWHEGRNFEHYRDVKPRFCSEFGFQSYPSMSVIRRFADPDDFNIAAPVMESHQKNVGGNARIAETMFRYFRFPVTFEDFVYVSQVQQALAIHTAVTFWRSLKPHCMGTLIWQLNDTWPVCSWASLDHGGGWKLLHYLARRFYAPVHVSATPQDDGFRLTAVNDSAAPVTLTIRAEALACDGRCRDLGVVTADIDIAAAMPVLQTGSLAADEVLVFSWHDGAQENANPDTGEQLAGEDHLAPRPYKELPLLDPVIQMQVSRQGQAFQITLMAEKPAFFVAVEADCDGRFSDNAVLLRPGVRRDITFISAEAEADANTGPDARDKPNFTIRHLHAATYNNKL